MAKIEHQEVGLPYEEITRLANREQVRALSAEGTSKMGATTYFIDFRSIQVRPGFNLRKVYQNIEELAADIQANGLVNPIRVDVLPDGRIFYETGHRRRMALQMLDDSGLLYDQPDKQGIREGRIECFVNTTETDELTRLVRQYSSNNQVPYTYSETAELCHMLNIYYSMNSTKISDQLGISRQTVDNMLLLANQSEVVKTALHTGKISPTAVINLVRKLDHDQEKIDAFVTAKGTKGEIMKVKHIKDIPIGNDHDPAEDVFDTTTEREEEKMCKEVKQRADQILTAVKSTENESLIMDVEHHLDIIQNRMEKIQAFVKKAF
jgi:ParB-like chromosome segregation protein Spo0J